MTLYQFKCPHCGHHMAEEVIMEATVEVAFSTADVDAQDGNSACAPDFLPDRNIQDGQTHHYQCATCGEALKLATPDGDGSMQTVGCEDDLGDWLIQHGIQIEDKRQQGVKYWILEVNGCTDPDFLQGAFETYEAMLNEARVIRKSQNEEDALFYVRTEDGRPPYVGAFVHNEICPEENEPRREEPSQPLPGGPTVQADNGDRGTGPGGAGPHGNT